MITVTINDPELERIYHAFHEDDEKFGEYLSLTTSAIVEEIHAEAKALGNNKLTDDAVFDLLKKKYDIQQNYKGK